MIGMSRISQLVKQHALNPLTIAAMRKSGDPIVIALADAFERTLSGKLEDVEKNALYRIEARRTSLLQRPDFVEEIDYGAGDPTATGWSRELWKHSRIRCVQPIQPNRSFRSAAFQCRGGVQTEERTRARCLYGPVGGLPSRRHEM
jgi:hypothetical protein